MNDVTSAVAALAKELAEVDAALKPLNAKKEQLLLQLRLARKEIDRTLNREMLDPSLPEGQVASLDLPNRVKNALIIDGIDTVDKLLAASGRDLHKIPGIGRLALRQIEECLAAKRSSPN